VKLSEYVEAASSEYLLETGEADLDLHWVAEFFQDSCLLEEYPRQDLVVFADLVQKSLTQKYEASWRELQLQMGRVIRISKQER
jgi:hypothetical protein